MFGMWRQAMQVKNKHRATTVYLLAMVQATVLSELQRASEAETLYRKALSGKAAALGGSHPATLQTVEQLAALLRHESRGAEADSLVAQYGGYEALPSARAALLSARAAAA